MTGALLSLTIIPSEHHFGLNWFSSCRPSVWYHWILLLNQFRNHHLALVLMSAISRFGYNISTRGILLVVTIFFKSTITIVKKISTNKIIFPMTIIFPFMLFSWFHSPRPSGAVPVTPRTQNSACSLMTPRQAFYEFFFSLQILLEICGLAGGSHTADLWTFDFLPCSTSTASHWNESNLPETMFSKAPYWTCIISPSLITSNWKLLQINGECVYWKHRLTDDLPSFPLLSLSVLKLISNDLGSSASFNTYSRVSPEMSLLWQLTLPTLWIWKLF